MILILFALGVFLCFGPKLLRFMTTIQHMKNEKETCWRLEMLSVRLFTLPKKFTHGLIRRCNNGRDTNLIKMWNLHDNLYVPTNGEMLKHIVDSSVEITKDSGYQVLERWLGQGLLISTGERWRMIRKMITPMFYFKMLETYMETMNKRARVCADLLEDKSGQEVDMYLTAKLCALDIICETAMGKDLEAQRNPDQEYVEAIETITRLEPKILYTPYLWIGAVRKLLGVEKEFTNAVQIAHDFTNKVIRNRKAAIEMGEEPNKRSFIDLLLLEREKANLTDVNLREEVDTFMFAGDDPDRDCTKDDFGSIGYLDQCIKEAERLYPPVPFVSRQLQDDFQMGEFLLPQHATIAIAPMVIHHNDTSEQSNEYDPDRFLPENIAKLHAYDFIPFSAGPRNCIGQKFAQYEIKIVLSWLLRRFRFVTERPMVSQKYSIEATLKPVGGMRITVMRR